MPNQNAPNSGVHYLNLEQASRAIVLCFAADIPVALWGPPGTGKSSLFAQMADNLGYKMYDFRLSDKEPSDIGGIPYPVDTDTGKKVSYLMPDGLPFDTDEKCIVLLDEMDRADISVQNVALQLLLDRMVNGHPLSPNARLGLCGNATSDVGTTPLSKAAANRICHIYIETHSALARKGWLKWANASGIVPEEFIGFMETRGGDYQPESSTDAEMAYFTERSFVSAGKIYAEAKAVSFRTDDIMAPLMAGCVGRAYANEVLAYCRNHGKAPTVIEILESPDTARVPDQPDVLHALTDTLVSHTHGGIEAINAFARYAMRWPEEPCTLLMRRLVQACPALSGKKVYRDWDRKRRISQSKVADDGAVAEKLEAHSPFYKAAKEIYEHSSNARHK